jgi:hypothetical protein
MRLLKESVLKDLEGEEGSSNNSSFRDGIAFDGNGFVGTAATAPAFSHLQPVADGKERLVDQTGIEPVTS